MVLSLAEEDFAILGVCHPTEEATVLHMEILSFRIGLA
jgi:hypothetical protein